MKRLAVAGVVALGLVMGSVSIASDAPANRSRPLVLNLISRATAINNFVDTGPPGFSPGDIYVFTDRLFLASAPDEQIGSNDGRCVLIDPAVFRFECAFTNHLREGVGPAAGDVMGAGTLTFAQGATSTFAVVGGTGPYRAARGEASVKLGPFGGPHEITANLILNP